MTWMDSAYMQLSAILVREHEERGYAPAMQPPPTYAKIRRRQCTLLARYDKCSAIYINRQHVPQKKGLNRDRILAFSDRNSSASHGVSAGLRTATAHSPGSQTAGRIAQPCVRGMTVYTSWTTNGSTLCSPLATFDVEATPPYTRAGDERTSHCSCPFRRCLRLASLPGALIVPLCGYAIAQPFPQSVSGIFGTSTSTHRDSQAGEEDATVYSSHTSGNACTQFCVPRCNARNLSAGTEEHIWE